MGATRDDFVKHPRTPHLFDSKGTDDDKHLGPEESRTFIADSSLIVEEKLDGTNVGKTFSNHVCDPLVAAVEVFVVFLRASTYDFARNRTWTRRC